MSKKGKEESDRAVGWTDRRRNRRSQRRRHCPRER